MAYSKYTFILKVLEGVSVYEVTSPFGERYLNGVKNFHSGIDLRLNLGRRIVAPVEARVIGIRNTIKASQTPTIIANKQTALYSGNYVRLEHGNGLVTEYFHLVEGSVVVKVGDLVKPGQLLGEGGNTGYSLGSHLHFAIRPNGGSAVDPLPYLLGQKEIKPFSPVTSLSSLYTPLPTLKILVDGLNYRAAAGGQKLGQLTKGQAYPVLGKTIKVDNFEWAGIWNGNQIVYTALNPAWNQIVEIPPVIQIKEVYKDLKLDQSVEGARILLEVIPTK